MLAIDRFDPGREVAGGSGKIPTAFLPGDFLIPCTVNAWGPSADNIIVHTAEDISLAFEVGSAQLCSLLMSCLLGRMLDYAQGLISNCHKFQIQQSCGCGKTL